MKRAPPLAAAVALVVVVAAAFVGCAPGEGATMGSMLASRPAQQTQAVHNVCPKGETTFGVDVSSFQNTIDWNAAAGAGVKFAFIRVSDGVTFLDDQYDANWAGAKAAGVLRGTYQFFRSDDDPIVEADVLLSHMGALEPGDLPPVLDYETTDEPDATTRIAHMHAWLDHVQEVSGVTPIIYTGGYFFDDNGADGFAQYPLWHAGYTGGDCPSTVANAWSDWAFWQYTSSGTVAGIPDAVDEDEFNGDLAALQTTLGAGEAVCGDGFCSPGEDHDSCAGDCPICDALPALGGEISEQGICFTGGGPQQFMRHVTDAGEDGDLIWTHATDDAAEANFGTWQVKPSEHGHYSIEAFTAAAYAQSTLAVYMVHHGGADDAHPVDQTAVDGWNLVVDDVELDPADTITVHLADNTGEPVANAVQLVFDALRVTRLDPSTSGEGEGSAGEGEGASGEGEGEGAIQPSHVKHTPAGVGGCASVPNSASLVVCAALIALARRRVRASAQCRSDR